MDAPAGRGHTRCLRRACTASAVRRVGTADRDSVGRVSRACCTFDPKARPCTLAVEGGATRDDYRARSRTRLPRGKPTRAIEAWPQRLLQPPPSVLRRTPSRYCRS